MKIVHNYILLGVLFAFMVISCRTDQSIDDTQETTNSVAMRILLNSIKEIYTVKHEGDTELFEIKDSICFDFIYPIDVAYNNGSTALVKSIDGLIDLALSETEDLFISGVVMPFEVVQYHDVITPIQSDLEFINLIKNCDMFIPNLDIFFGDCFSIQYPFKTSDLNSNIYTINSEDEFVSFINNHFDDWFFEFVYPLQIVLTEDGNLYTIDSDFELFNLLDTCYDCDCSDEYKPVCVNYEGQIFQFINMCNAICNGFNTEDIITCEVDSTACFSGRYSSFKN